MSWAHSSPRVAQEKKPGQSNAGKVFAKFILLDPQVLKELVSQMPSRIQLALSA